MQLIVENLSHCSVNRWPSILIVCAPVAAFLLCLPTAAAADDLAGKSQPLLRVKGERLPAAMISLVSDGEMVFTADKGELHLPLKDAVQWGAAVEPRSMVELVLADGGIIVLEDEMPTTADDSLAAVAETFGNMKLPLRLLAGIMLHSPIDPQRRDRLATRLLVPSSDNSTAVSDNRDWLFFENGDELQGRITAMTESGVEFTADVGPLTVERERLAAIAFDPSLRAKRSSASGTLVGFADGSIVFAKSIALKDRTTDLRLADGSPLSADGIEPTYLQPLLGQVSYLSDHKPSGYRHIPYLNTPWDYRLDANVNGTRLRAGGSIYSKGVGMHSASRLTWQLEKPYRRFEADLAIDDQTENRGSVVFRVFAGSRELYKSPVIRGGDKPLPISVEVGDVRQLSLIVDFADRADVLDHADWLNARLVP